MQLSTKVRYGTRILVRLARQEGPVSREEIADLEGLTKPYIYKIANELKAAGLVGSEKGRNGGYFLAKPAESINLAEVYEVFEGPLCLVPCDDEACKHKSNCTTTGVWEDASQALRSELEKRTIADLAGAATL